MQNYKVKLEKEKKIEEPEVVEVTIPSYFKSINSAIMVTKDTIIRIFPNFITSYPLTFENYKYHCNNDISDRKAFMQFFYSELDSLRDKIQEPSFFDDLKNDEEHFYEEAEMNNREEEYYYSQENGEA